MKKKEFQELKRKWSIEVSERNELELAMRENIKKRNNGSREYVIRYTTPGVVYDIDSCDIQGLFSIDGDMIPQGK